MFDQKPIPEQMPPGFAPKRPVESNRLAQFDQVNSISQTLPIPQRPAPSQFDEHSWIAQQQQQPVRRLEETSQQQFSEAQRLAQSSLQSVRRTAEAERFPQGAKGFVESQAHRQFPPAGPVESHRSPPKPTKPPRPSQTQKIAQVIQQNTQSPMLRPVEAGQQTAESQRFSVLPQQQPEQFVQQPLKSQRPVKFQEPLIQPAQHFMEPKRFQQVIQPAQQPMRPQSLQQQQVTQRTAQPVQQSMESQRLPQDSQRPDAAQQLMEPQRLLQQEMQRPVERPVQPVQQFNQRQQSQQSVEPRPTPPPRPTQLTVQQRQKEPVPQPAVEPQRIDQKARQRPVEPRRLEHEPFQTAEFVEPAKNSLESLFQLDPTTDTRLAQEQLTTLIQLLSLSASQSGTGPSAGTFPSIPNDTAGRSASTQQSNVVPFIAFSDPLPLESNSMF